MSTEPSLSESRLTSKSDTASSVLVSPEHPGADPDIVDVYRESHG
jgi:hypothetical protein